VPSRLRASLSRASSSSGLFLSRGKMSTPSETGKAPKGDGGAETINLKVAAQDGIAELFFKLKTTTPLSKLMKIYCERQGVPAQSARFL
jgi:hypothetical protein